MSQSSDKILAEIEKELYDALEGLESGDLIIVRQCAARIQSSSIAAWKQQRKEGHLMQQNG